MEQTCAPGDQGTEITLKGIEIAAKVFGVAVPSVNLLGILIEAVSERKTKRQFQRLEKLISSVIPRLERLEENLSKQTEPDLLDEILAKAVNDEDEAKTDYYAALIEYCVSGTQDAYQVRLLADAIKGLTPHEIRAFVHFNKHGAVRHDIPDDLRDIFWDRMSTFGLHPRGKKERAESSTVLGDRFLDVCRLADEPATKVHA
jgi:hypothetical protein